MKAYGFKSISTSARVIRHGYLSGHRDRRNPGSAGDDGQFADGQTGFARCHTDFETGEFRFETVKPGSVDWTDGSPQAPHITLMIFARGINIHLHTRIYFADETDANASDPVLSAITDGRETLLATPDAGSNNSYRFDVSLQGDAETVFFDI